MENLEIRKLGIIFKESKIVNFVHFSNKRRFKQMYKTSLWNDTETNYGL